MSSAPPAKRLQLSTGLGERTADNTAEQAVDEDDDDMIGEYDGEEGGEEEEPVPRSPERGLADLEADEDRSLQLIHHTSEHYESSE